MSINLDANASYGLLPEVEAALARGLGDALNPSSIHRGGQRARALIEGVRKKFQAFTGLGDEYEIVFTSGATESNNSIFGGIACRNDRAGKELIANETEHPSVLAPIERIATLGYVWKKVQAQSSGAVLRASYQSHCSEQTALISCMLANNETGVIYPVAEIFKEARLCAPQALLHCDAVQGLGKMTGSMAQLDADALTFSGHKIGALSGVGVCALKRDLDLPALLIGGPQESRHRAGTENVLGILSLGIALDVWSKRGAELVGAMRSSADFVLKNLENEIPNLVLHGRGQGRLPNTLSMLFPGTQADDILVGLDSAGIFASAGSACASGKPEPSHVLRAIGLPALDAKATIRLSFRGDEARADLEHAVRTLVELVRRQTRY